MRLQALFSSATLLLLSIGPLCTAADASEAGNIKVESAANQNGPDVASDLVCPLFSLFSRPHPFTTTTTSTSTMSFTQTATTTETTLQPQLTYTSLQSGTLSSPIEVVHEVVVTLEQIAGEPNTPRHVEAKKKLMSNMARDAGTWNKNHPRHRLLDALYGFSKYHERQKVELDRFEGFYKHVTKSQRAVSQTLPGNSV